MTKITMKFETMEEYQKLLERIKNFEYEIDENSKDDVEILFEKERIKLKSKRTQIVVTSGNITYSSLTENFNSNKSLDDLRQKLINELHEKELKNYNQNDIEVLKTLLENERY